MRFSQILLFSLCLMAGPALLMGQTDFKFIAKTDQDLQDDPLTSGERYEKAKAIFDRLAEARGDYRFPVPKFIMSNRENNVAYLEGDGLSIGLEVKAYDLCMSLGEKEGENALAALLGHELTHFYEKHQWRRGFAEANNNLDVGRTLMGADTDTIYRMNCETQADYLGGFLAYSAGYPVYDKLPEFYDAVYKDYKLEKKMKKYASLDDRKALAVRSLENLNKLVDVFEMANLLTAIGQFEQARSYYQYILIQYQGREVYNNLGVLTVLFSLQYFNGSEMPYRLPLQLDLNFGADSRSGAAENEQIRKDLLEEAIRYFDNATAMDSKYAPAYQNKAVAYYLLGDYDRARYFAETEAKSRAADNPTFQGTIVNADILLAMIEEKTNSDKGKAIAMLKALQGKKSSVAEFNLYVMENGSKPESPRKSQLDPYPINIDGVEDISTAAKNFETAGSFSEQWVFSKIVFRSYDKIDQLPNSKIFFSRPPRGFGNRIYFHLTKTGSTEKTDEGLGIGSSREDMLKEYGAPSTVLPLTSGEIAVYSEMLFILDADLKIKAFGNYMKL